ncbi:unnamed protein product, partial [Sphenostylis stenocarpa]
MVGPFKWHDAAYEYIPWTMSFFEEAKICSIRINEGVTRNRSTPSFFNSRPISLFGMDETR